MRHRTDCTAHISWPITDERIYFRPYLYTPDTSILGLFILPDIQLAKLAQAMHGHEGFWYYLYSPNVGAQTAHQALSLSWNHFFFSFILTLTNKNKNTRKQRGSFTCDICYSALLTSPVIVEVLSSETDGIIAPGARWAYFTCLKV